jgi:lipoprotein Spr
MSQYDDWRGVRYRPGGSDYRGVDCSGLVQAIFRDAFEMDLPRTSIEQSKMGESVARGEIQPGDLLYFVDRGRKHVGVAVNENQFVHASRKKGVILSKFDKYWTPRLLRVRRLLDEKDRNAFFPKGG